MQKIKAEIIQPSEYSFGSRIETGALEIEYENGEIDWPEIFIRGDDSLMCYVPALTYLLEHVNMDSGSMVDVMRVCDCKDLLDLLQGCAIKPKE